MFDAIVLAGAASRRLDGADKAMVAVGGRTLLDAVLAAAHGAGRLVVVGPRRPVSADVTWAEEDPPGGGPVAAIAAGLDLVAAPWCLVLATDLPDVAAAVPLLLTAAEDGDVAVLAGGGRRNHLAAAWRTDALRGALARLDTVRGAAARELYTGAKVIEIDDTDGWGRDVDTWDDVEQARHG